MPGMAKQASLAALSYLAAPKKHPAGPLTVIYGDEPFLKHACSVAIRQQVLQGEDAECSLTVLAGKTAELREMLDAVMTLSLFSSGPRLVIVEDADPFVKRFRGELETYAERPTQNGMLVFEVESWPRTTRLAKRVADAAWLTIECKTPPPGELAAWVTKWADSRHGIKIEASAAAVLIDRAGSELGLLDQELAKLAVHVGDGAAITPELIKTHVGGWRVDTAWEMIDAALSGRADQALAQLGKLLDAGEEPHAVLPMLASSLRKLAAAGQLIQRAEAAGRRRSIPDALKEVRIPPFKLREAEQQLRQLGRIRANQCLDWLLAADLEIKGVHSSKALSRWVIERLIAQLSTAGDPRRG